MPASVFERLQAFLQDRGILFTVSHHAPVYTSEEAAAIRGVPLASGAKALVVKAGNEFRLLVIPADRKLDSKKGAPGSGSQARCGLPAVRRSSSSQGCSLDRSRHWAACLAWPRHVTPPWEKMPPSISTPAITAFRCR